MAIRFFFTSSSSSPSPSLTFLFSNRRISPLIYPLTYTRYYYYSKQATSVAYNVIDNASVMTSKTQVKLSRHNDQIGTTVNSQKGHEEKEGDESSINSFKRQQKRKRISPKQLSIALQKRRENTRPLPPPPELTEVDTLSNNSNSNNSNNNNNQGTMTSIGGEEKGKGQKREDRGGVGVTIGKSKMATTPRISPKQLSLALQKRRQESKEKEIEKLKEKEEKKREKEQENLEKVSSTKESTSPRDEHTTDTTLIMRQRKKLFRHQTTPNVTIGESDYRDVYKVNLIYKEKQDKLIAHIQNKLGTDIKIDESQFKNMYTPPSVVGVSPKDIDTRLEELSSVGFTRFECAKLLPVLPYCIRIDFKALHDVCRLFERYNIRWAHFLNKELSHMLLLGANNTTTVRIYMYA